MNYLTLFSSILLLVSCQNQPAQKLENLDKKSAREVTLTTVTKGDSVLHITKQKIWYNGEQIAEQNDTLITADKPSTWGGTDTTSLRQVPIYVTVQ
ncbi:hypothetical protein J5U18_09105 [Sphingobacteriaceae bacterium WQ 2009]|uniref:Uncharacterized protein n=1 Tax=Rhinopithecimicrobium faecis TaxID=2820698 RepID=A0A8T4HEE8_9SPHI|nr:hypothetical protein [Sphingobacteriaceae bacterium WQ 2009]